MPERHGSNNRGPLPSRELPIDSLHCMKRCRNDMTFDLHRRGSSSYKLYRCLVTTAHPRAEHRGRAQAFPEEAQIAIGRGPESRWRRATMRRCWQKSRCVCVPCCSREHERRGPVCGAPDVRSSSRSTLLHDHLALCLAFRVRSATQLYVAWRSLLRPSPEAPTTTNTRHLRAVCTPSCCRRSRSRTRATSP